VYCVLPFYADLFASPLISQQFAILKVNNNPQHHWRDNTRWEMAQAIGSVVLNKTKEIVQAATFFSLSCNEVTLVYYQSWISVHGDVLRD
jgi:hypothetical protein